MTNLCFLGMRMWKLKKFSPYASTDILVLWQVSTFKCKYFKVIKTSGFVGRNRFQSWCHEVNAKHVENIFRTSQPHSNDTLFLPRSLSEDIPDWDLRDWREVSAWKKSSSLDLSEWNDQTFLLLLQFIIKKKSKKSSGQIAAIWALILFKWTQLKLEQGLL